MVVMLMSMATAVVVMVMMLMLVTVAFMVVVMLVLVTIAVVVMVVMLMLVAIAFMVMVIVMMTAFGADFFVFEFLKLVCHGITAFHSLEKLFSVKLFPWGSYYYTVFVMLSQKLDAFLNFVFACLVRVAQYNCSCVLYLVSEEFTEVLKIHFAFVCIGNGCVDIELGILCMHSFYGTYYVTELSYSGGLYEYSVGRVLF